MRVSLLLVVLVSLALLVSGSTPGDRRLGTSTKLTASEAAALGRSKLSGSSTTAATTSSAKPAAAASSSSKPVATQSASTSTSAASSTSTSKKATTDATTSSTTTSSTPAVASIARVATSTTSNLKTCASQCLNGGYCYDGTCQCPFGFNGLYCQTKQSCPIDPTSSLQCGGVSRGSCDPTTLKCVCAPGFTGDQCQNADKLCGGTNCNNHGSCVKGLCFCDAGFTGTTCERQTSCGTDATNPCGGRGLCYDNKCLCYPGFTGEFCQTPLRDFQSCKNNCTGRGVCEFGQCLCPPQFSGDDCSQHEAGSFCAVAGGDCSGHGICSDNKCICEPGTSGTFCEKGGCKKCHPRHGVCLGDKCFCQPGYGGDDCSTALTCSNNCNNHGTCVAGKCQCEKYFSGNACEKSEFPAGVCPNKCSGNGVCYEGKCLCITGRSGSDCSTVIPTTCGSAPPTVVALSDSTSALVPAPVTGPDCNGNGNCFRKLCVCKPGYYGDYCEKKRVCSAECSKNGICNYGSCLCAPDFTGVDCQISTHRQQELLSISGTALDQYREKDFTCVDGDKQKCSLHGTCKSNKCVCDEGFSGLICESILITGVYSNRCPSSCSNHGFCQLGKCVCDLGYTGDACQTKLDIPCTNNCNGKGICEFGRCHCDADYAGLACETKLKCSVDCASKSQGVCVAGRCVCLNGYTGIDCSYAPATSNKKAALLFATTSKKARFAALGQDAEGEVESSNELESLVDHPVHAELSAAAAAPGLGQYVVPMPPVVMGVLAFVLGVLVAFIINYAWAKREEQVRKQKMLKPLLSSR